MSEAPALPTLSILLPVRNEANNLARCLDGIFANDYPHDRLELLVIDGQSDDATLDIVRQYQQRHPRIRLLDNPQRLPYTALNIALAHATGEYLVRVDARSMIPTNYLRTCIETLRETGADNVGGVQRQYGVTPRQEAIALATGHRFGVGNAQFRLGTQSGFVDTVYLGCFRRELFDRIGHFDEDGPVISEDAGFNQRIRDAGGRVYLRADLVVRYPAKATFGALARQYFIYGGAKAHFVLKYRKFTAWRQLVPLLFLVGLVGSLLVGLWWTPALVLFALAAGTYLGVDLAVAVTLAARHRRWDLLPFLIATFPCIHFPWPVGFLVRLCEGSTPGRHWRG